MHEPGLQGKSHDIPKRLVWYAWLRVKENGGAAGPDGVTIEQFQEKVQDNLYSKLSFPAGILNFESSCGVCDG